MHRSDCGDNTVLSAMPCQAYQSNPIEHEPVDHPIQSSPINLASNAAMSPVKSAPNTPISPVHSAPTTPIKTLLPETPATRELPETPAVRSSKKTSNSGAIVGGAGIFGGLGGFREKANALSGSRFGKTVRHVTRSMSNLSMTPKKKK